MCRFVKKKIIFLADIFWQQLTVCAILKNNLEFWSNDTCCIPDSNNYWCKNMLMINQAHQVATERRRRKKYQSSKIIISDETRSTAISNGESNWKPCGNKTYMKATCIELCLNMSKNFQWTTPYKSMSWTWKLSLRR